MLDIQILALGHESDRLNNETNLLFAIADNPEQLTSLGLSGEALEELSGEGLVGKIFESIKKAAIATKDFILRMWRKFIGLFKKEKIELNTSAIVNNTMNSLVASAAAADKDWRSIRIDSLTVPVGEQDIPESNKEKIVEILDKMDDKKKNEVAKVVVEKATSKKITKAAELVLLAGGDLVNDVKSLYRVNVDHNETVAEFYKDVEDKLKEVLDLVERKDIKGIKAVIDAGVPGAAKLTPNGLLLPGLFKFLPIPDKASLLVKKDALSDAVFKPGDFSKLNKVKTKKVNEGTVEKLILDMDKDLRDLQKKNLDLFDERSDYFSEMFDTIEDLDIDKDVSKSLGKFLNKLWGVLSNASKVDIALLQTHIWAVNTIREVTIFHSTKTSLDK